MNIYIWPTLLLAAALFMVFLEIFIPSLGLIPLAAVGLALASIWSAFNVSTSFGCIFLVVELALTPIVIMIAASIWPHTPIARFFMLKPPGTDDEKTINSRGDDNNYARELQSLVGHIGRAMTDLKPGGTVEVANLRLDALTDEGFINADTLVKVIGTRQSQLLVRSV